MKAQKKLNLLIVILIVILLSTISFAGIYYKNKNEMKNAIPDYQLGEDLKGYRQIVLKVKDSSDTSSTGGNTTSTEETNEVSTNEVSTNEVTNEITSDDTESNASKYAKSAEIFRKRFKSLGVKNYSVSVDEATGEIFLKIPENDQTDSIISDITQKGVFSIKDSETNDVLLNNKDIKSVDISFQGASTSKAAVYMTIKFNSKGTSKLTKVSSEYQNFTDVNSTATNEVSETNEATSNEVSTNETSDESTSTEKKSKKVKMMIDDTEMMTTYFDKVIDNGELSLTLSMSDTDSSNTTQLYSAYNLKAILENDPLDVDYEVAENTYISSEFENDELKLVIYCEIAICLIIALALIIKYRDRGVLFTILSIGYLAILLLVLRYTNVVFSLLSIIGIAIDVLMSLIFDFMILKETNKKDMTQKEKSKVGNKVIKKYSLTIMPMLIISIVCSINGWENIFGIGMVMFWGVVINWIYNSIITKLYLK